MAGGGIMLFINLFSLFAWATPCGCDDIFMKALAPVIGLIQTCVFLAGIMLFINLFSLFAWATPCECDDIFMKALAPVIGLIQTCVFLAGTIVVFGWY